ncbi:YidH family protein [Microbacterium halophytorum]|uniref:YidH family protein n=1 Tax=Microbacterium halophytorum TaxID=2067568 RepID=UPI000CFC4778|nr:DUF202 domain-containing protein [Microbacterium halophytorum]
MAKSRFPQRVYRDGDEPDPRFSLANERTFLAWLRTSLALFAAAIALEALQLPINAGWRLAGAVVFLVLGVIAAVQAWFGWVATEKSLRRGAALPGLSIGGVLVVGVIVGVAIIFVGGLV